MYVEQDAPPEKCPTACSERFLVSLEDMLRMISGMADMRFASVLMVFRTNRACFALHARVRAETWKNEAVGRPKPPPESPKPSKIKPGAAQDAEKPVTRDKKRSKMRKKRPRSAQEPKIVPTYFQEA